MNEFSVEQLHQKITIKKKRKKIITIWLQLDEPGNKGLLTGLSITLMNDGKDVC